MTWFRVDDGFYDHPKVEALLDDPVVGSQALALWTLAGSYCAKHLTDGHVPERTARKLVAGIDYKAAAAALVAVGLWQPTEAGWLFCDWTDWQLSRAAVEAERARARDKKARQRSTKGDTSDVPGGQPQGHERGSPGDNPTATSVTAWWTSRRRTRPTGSSSSAWGDMGDVPRFVEAVASAALPTEGVPAISSTEVPPGHDACPPGTTAGTSAVSPPPIRSDPIL